MHSRRNGRAASGSLWVRVTPCALAHALATNCGGGWRQEPGARCVCGVCFGSCVGVLPAPLLLGRCVLKPKSSTLFIFISNLWL
jgi:hypothetical protein